jgi:hypothetical protein
MATRKHLLVLVLAVLMLPGLLVAYTNLENATVLLRNGERVAGQFEGIANGVVYVRVSLADQRKIPVGNVALIDFVGGASGLPETELSSARGDEHLLVLKNSTRLTGRFVDVRVAEAGTPDLLYFRTDGEERRFPLGDVGRLYLGRFPGAATTLPAPVDPAPGGGIQVPGNTAWIATPLRVQQGDRVRFSVTGRVQLSDNPEDVAVPDGSLKQRRTPGAPIPQSLTGQFIARVGRSAPFPVGANATITMPADGQLFVGVNDDELRDNTGNFFVTVQRERRR